jgi:hypothetical protein
LDRKLQFTYPKASIKEAQTTGEAFKREHQALQNMKSQSRRPKMTHKSKNFHVLVIVAFLDSDPATQINADPDPQPWL